MNYPVDKWMKEFKGAITICDREGMIVYMNDKSIENYAEYGGAALLGKNLLDCHSEATKPRLKQMLITSTQNHYTIEKKGVKKFINQSSWIENGEIKGLIELIFILPSQ